MIKNTLAYCFCIALFVYSGLAQSPFGTSKQSVVFSNAQSGASERWAAILFPSSATANYRLVLPSVAPTTGQLLNIASVSGNDATLQWRNVSDLAWGLTGNSGTTPGTNFIGTTDAQDVMFKANNTEWLTLKQSSGFLHLNQINQNTMMGYQVANMGLTGGANTGLGYQALYNTTTGSGNVAVGFVSLSQNQTGTNNTGVGIVALNGILGSYNVGVGAYSGYFMTGERNTLLGYYAGFLHSSGDRNIFIGDSSRHPSGTTGSNLMSIGNAIYGNGINTTSPRIGIGAVSYASDVTFDVRGHTAISNADNTAKELRFYEPSNSGLNYTAFKAQAQTSNITYTLPASDGALDGDVLTTNAAGVLRWSTVMSSVRLNTISAANGSSIVNHGNYWQTWEWNSLASNTAMSLSTNSTAAASNTQTLLNLSMSGANANATQTTYASQISNTHTGTSSTNIGLSLSASGGTNNYALVVPSGSVGIGTVAPQSELHIDRGTSTASSLLFTVGTTTGVTPTDGLKIGVSSNGTGEIRQQENLPLDFYTNNTQVLRLNSNGSIQRGADGNARGANAVDLQYNPSGVNVASGSASFIGGGDGNRASGLRSFTGGGWGNLSQGNYSVTVGGSTNNNQASSAFIGSGYGNTIGISADNSVIVAGENNSATGSGSFVGAGSSNGSTGLRSVVVGGYYNGNAGDYGFIGSGANDTISDGNYGVIAGGSYNKVSSPSGAIVAGDNNFVSGNQAIIGGGTNHVASGMESGVFTGRRNTTSGMFSSIVGGYGLTLGNNSFGFSAWSNDNNRPVPPANEIAYFGDVNIWLGNVTNSAKELRFYEPNTSLTYSSTNYTAFKAQAQTSNITYTLPASDGALDGDVLTTNAAGVLRWSTVMSSVRLNTISAANGSSIVNHGNYWQTWEWNSLASNTAMSLSTNSTAAASNTQTLLNLSMSGANANTTQTTYASQISNTHTGTSSTNIGLSLSASGGTNNYALVVPNGSVGIGTTTPGYNLEVNGATIYFRNGSTPYFYAAGGPNVGIGMSSTPNSPLTVGGGTSIGYNLSAPLNGLIVEGNTGIGVSSPTARLQVSGTTIISDTLTLNGYSGTSGGRSLFINGGDLHVNGGTDGMFGILQTNSGTQKVGFYGSDVVPDMIVDNIANTVGIGTGSVSGSERLEVKDGNIGITNSGTARELRFYEPSASGSHFTALKAQVQASNITYTLPATAPTVGQLLSSDASGNLSWVSSGGVSGSGTNTAVTFWTGTSTMSGNSNFIWNNTTQRLGIWSSSPTARLQVGGRIVTTIGTDNTFVSAGNETITGSLNTGLGTNALQSISSGASNIAVGRNALGALTTSSNNTSIGTGSLSSTTGANNIALGFQAGDALTSGSNNIIIGYDVDAPSASGSNQLTIGNLIFGTGIDGTGTTVSTGAIGIGTASPVTGAILDLRGNLAITNNDNIARELRFYEPSSSGLNYSTFKAQAQAADITYTLPASDGSNGAKLETNGSGSLSWSNTGTVKYARKTANEVITNSTTQQNDDHLSLSVGANEVWECEIFFRVVVTSNTNGGVKMKLNFPAGTSVMMQSQAWIGYDASTGYLGQDMIVGSYDFYYNNLKTDVTGGNIIRLHGMINVGSTAGTVQWQFCQQTLNAVSTTGAVDSYMKLTRIQ